MADEIETWKTVPGWPGVEVSDLGRVRSWHMRSATNRQLIIRKLQMHYRDGYWMVTLQQNKVRKVVGVHILVLSAFVGPRPEGLAGCHNDGDRSNSRLSNLRWDTNSANNDDAVRHGHHRSASKTECVNGHAFDDRNTYYVRKPTGRISRCCRICNRAAQRRRYQLRKLAQSDGH